MSKSLYDEAIAEARQLRDVAEQNAKNAIIEAVTPKIREFIEEQLVSDGSSKRNDDSDSILESVAREVVSGTSDEVALDESALDELVSLLSKTQTKNERKNILQSIHESMEDLTDSQRAKLTRILDNLSESERSFNHGEIGIDTDLNEETGDMSGKSSSSEVFYEIDLDTLSAESISSLFEDDSTDTDLPEDDSDHLELDLGEEMDDRSNVTLGQALSEVDLLIRNIDSALGLEEEPGEETLDPTQLSTELELSEEGDDDLDMEEPVEDDMDADADADADLPPLDDLGPLPEPEGEDMEEVVYDIDENMLRRELRKLRGLSEETDPKLKSFGDGSVVGEPFVDMDDSKLNVQSEVKKLRNSYLAQGRKNRALTQKLKEYRGAIETLREQLTEMNLFNAKLLYVNKLLQNQTVTPSQRRSIIESLDGAKTLREVKLLYRSLTDSLSGKRAKSGNINESRARRPMGSSSRTMTRGSASNAGAEVDRWAKLAGLND